MYITSSAVQMNSSRSYRETTRKATISSSWNVLTGAFETTKDLEGTTDSAFLSQNTVNNESTNPNSSFMDSYQNMRQRFEETRDIARVSPHEDYKSSLHNMRQEMINYLLNLLFGKKEALGNLVNDQTPYQEAQATKDFSVVNNGIGGQIQNYFYYSESEEVTFDTSATVNTADGRSINVSMSLSLSRTFVEETSSIIDYGQPLICDPLVINVNCDSTHLTSQKFLFDLDCDGNKESISMVTGGSGFLALDKNNDGIINDGSELFGTQSGDGFKDLATYDSDQNGWIDEADEIFTKLKIWFKDENGNDKLLNLKEAGVGAIYLGSKNSQFSLTNPTNEVNAYIRKTGMFLYENGMAGTLQQVDLAISDAKA